MARVELLDRRVAGFTNVRIAKEKYEQLVDKDFQVLINVFTGRRSFTGNLLNCDILKEGIESVKGKRHILKGKLIYGD